MTANTATASCMHCGTEIRQAIDGAWEDARYAAGCGDGEHEPATREMTLEEMAEDLDLGEPAAEELEPQATAGEIDYDIDAAEHADADRHLAEQRAEAYAAPDAPSGHEIVAEHTCHGAIFCGQGRAAARAACPACPADDRTAEHLAEVDEDDAHAASMAEMVNTAIYAPDEETRLSAIAELIGAIQCDDSTPRATAQLLEDVAQRAGLTE